MRTSFSATNCACKRDHVFKNLSESQKKVRLDMWFDGENYLFNAECITNNILANVMLILVHNQKVTFLGIPFLRHTQ